MFLTKSYLHLCPQPKRNRLNNKANITLSFAEHNQTPVVKVVFDYNQPVINKLKETTNARWSASQKCWYIARKEFNLNTFFQNFRELAYVDYSGLKTEKSKTTEKAPEKNYSAQALKQQLSAEVRIKIDEFRNWMQQKRYSDNTVKTYIHQLEIFFGFYAEKKPDEITNTDITAFNREFVLKYNLSATFQNQTISALKKFLKFQLNNVLEYDFIERPIKSHTLPKVIDKKDLELIFASIKNEKHKLAFETIYAHGLRRGELLNLKLEHIDSKQGMISIINAKGKRDRMVPISKK